MAPASALFRSTLVLALLLSSSEMAVAQSPRTQQDSPRGLTALRDTALKCAQAMIVVSAGYIEPLVIPWDRGAKPKYSRVAKLTPWYHFADTVLTYYLPKREVNAAEIEYDQAHSRWFFKNSNVVLEKGAYTVVMSPGGRIFAKPGVKHASLSWGANVASALEIDISSEGEIERILPRTGHYWRMFRSPRSAGPVLGMRRLDPHINWQNFVSEIHSRGASAVGVPIANVYHRRANPNNPDERGRFEVIATENEESPLYGFTIDAQRLEEALQASASK